MKGIPLIAISTILSLLGPPPACAVDGSGQTLSESESSIKELSVEVERIEQRLDVLDELRQQLFLLSSGDSQSQVVMVDSKTGGRGFARILGGSPVPEGELSHCAAVGGGVDFYCTGTLVSPDVVVTAKHCLPGIRTVFLRGSSLFSPENGEIIQVKSEHPHPTADLAVLVLEESSSVPPARLAQACHLAAATEALVAGFGTTNFAGTIGYGVKRFIQDLPIADRDCSDPLEWGCEPGIELVAGLRGLDRDSCRGDSGGPLYLVHEGEPLLIGATSRGAKGATRVCGDGGIYVRVDAFVTWIEQVTGSVLIPADC